MKAETIEVRQARVGFCRARSLNQAGKGCFPRGISFPPDDAELLLREWLGRVWVTHLEEGEVSEDSAVVAVGDAMGCGASQVKLAPGGRANIVATGDWCVLVNDELLKQINCTASTVIATVQNFSSA